MGAEMGGCIIDKQWSASSQETEIAVRKHWGKEKDLKNFITGEIITRMKMTSYKTRRDWLWILESDREEEITEEILEKYGNMNTWMIKN